MNIYDICSICLSSTVSRCAESTTTNIVTPVLKEGSNDESTPVVVNSQEMQPENIAQQESPTTKASVNNSDLEEDTSKSVCQRL